jgi:hypothetical protein
MTPITTATLDTPAPVRTAHRGAVSDRYQVSINGTPYDESELPDGWLTYDSRPFAALFTP